MSAFSIKELASSRRGAAVARFVLTRLVQSLAALAILSVVVFVLARATGDPLHLILPMSASEEDYANARRYLGLDRPYVEQYLSFVGRSRPRYRRALA